MDTAYTGPSGKNSTPLQGPLKLKRRFYECRAMRVTCKLKASNDATKRPGITSEQWAMHWVNERRNRRDALGPSIEQCNEKSNKQHNAHLRRIANMVMSRTISSAMSLAMSRWDDVHGPSTEEYSQCGNEHRHEQGNEWYSSLLAVQLDRGNTALWWHYSISLKRKYRLLCQCS